MFGINLKVLVAMVTELCTHSISAMAYNACHAPEICILHTSVNFEKSKTQFFSNYFLKSINSVFFAYTCMFYALKILSQLKIEKS